MPRDPDPKENSELSRFLSRESELLQDLKTLRENGDDSPYLQPCLGASVIAEQYFCEKKVEMERIHGRIETESKRQGSEGHESLLVDAVQVEREQIFKEIFDGELVVVHEVPLIARALYEELMRCMDKYPELKT